MYAIVATGGKQLKVSPGDVVEIERLSDEPLTKGDAVTFQDVAFVADGDTFRSGKPSISGVAVKATVLAETKTRKVLIFKKKRRKQYRRTKGHRQQVLSVRIDSIEG